MKRNVKIFCAALALVLVFGAVVGGTIAWLMDSTKTITNVFTVGDVDITLTETDPVSGDSVDSGNLEFKMIPGVSYTKDPTVTIDDNSEDCYVFVKVVKDFDEVTVGEGESAVTYGFDDFIECALLTNDDTWAPVPDVADVYYYQYEQDGDNQTVLPVLIGDANNVKIKDTVTKEMMDAITDNNVPSLSFTAYAIQSNGLPAVQDSATAVWNANFAG